MGTKRIVTEIPLEVRATTKNEATRRKPTSLQRWLADVDPGGEQALEDYAAAYARGEVRQDDDRPSQLGALNEDNDPLFAGAVRKGGPPLRQRIAPRFPEVEKAINWIFVSATSLGLPRGFYYSQSPEVRGRIWDNCWGAAHMVLVGIYPPTNACLVSRIKTRMAACLREQMKFYDHYRTRDPVVMRVEGARLTDQGSLLGGDHRDDESGALISIYDRDVADKIADPTKGPDGHEIASVDQIFDAEDSVSRRHESGVFGRRTLDRLQDEKAERRANKASKAEKRDLQWQQKREERLRDFAVQWPNPWEDGTSSLVGHYLCGRCRRPFLPFDLTSVYCSTVCEGLDAAAGVSPPSVPIRVLPEVTSTPEEREKHVRERGLQQTAADRAAVEANRYREMFARVFRSEASSDPVERNWRAFDDWLRGTPARRRPAAPSVRRVFEPPAESSVAVPGPAAQLEAIAIGELSPRDATIWRHRNDGYGSVGHLAQAMKPAMSADAYRKARERVKDSVESRIRQLEVDSDVLRDRLA